MQNEEIKVMPFVNQHKNQTIKLYNKSGYIKKNNQTDLLFKKEKTGIISPIDQAILSKAEANERFSNAKMSEKAEIFNEIAKKEEQKRRIRERKRQIEQKEKIKIKIFVGGFILLTATLGQIYSSYVAKVTAPAYIVSNDVLANVNLLESDNGKKLDPTQFESNETNLLYRYIKENNISSDKIYKTVSELCQKNDIAYDYALVKLYNKYPELFENALIDQTNEEIVVKKVN
ncbi:MAG: hypothetical protein PHN42_00890 [Bacilli bacterium]|nr:hypothetical protein [Bacilli bacterium]